MDLSNVLITVKSIAGWHHQPAIIFTVIRTFINTNPVLVEIKRNIEVNNNVSISLNGESIRPNPSAKARLEKCKV